MHSLFSGDSDSSLESMAESAVAKGLPGICFTDHLDYDFPDGTDAFLLDLPRYRQAVLKLQEQYSGRLEIRFGIELGLQPHLAAKHASLFQEWDFDFVIGSSHIVHGMDPYYPYYYEGRTEDEAYQEYFESIAENIRAFSDIPTGCCFDVYGHLDYAVRYGPNKNANYSYEKYQDIIDEILKLLIHAGKGIEVNTAGLKYGLGHPNPCEGILKRYRELGGEILTIGADGHMPDHVGYGFCGLAGLLQNCGFSYYTVFKGRKAKFLPIA